MPETPNTADEQEQTVRRSMATSEPPADNALARIWKATADDLAAKLEAAEAENERLRRTIAGLQVYGNMPDPMAAADFIAGLADTMGASEHVEMVVETEGAPDA